MELALWKISLNENNYQYKMVQCQKKGNADESITRRQCHITCGADAMIGHVLPYLITESDEESESESIASSKEKGMENASVLSQSHYE